MKLWLAFFLLSCGCFTYSQDFNGSQIKQVGDVVIIDNTNSELSEVSNAATASSKLNPKDRRSKEFNKRKTQTYITNLHLADYSKETSPKKLKSQKLVYKNSNNDTFFLNSSKHTFSAVLSYSNHSQLKKDFFHWVNNRVFSQDLIIKQNTYYYLFYKDTGKLYQFFNKPPPSFIFS